MPFLHERMLIMQVSLVMTAAAATAAQLALPNCQDKCGDITIPYPFGVTEKCSMGPEFFISCAANGTQFLGTTNTHVTNISVDLGEIQVQQYRAYDCYDELGNNTYNIPKFRVDPPYTISGTKNKFMAVGCDTYATFRGYRANQERFITGCMSLCDSLNSVEQDSCSGIGCCQTSIPDGLKNHTVTLRSYYNHTYVRSFNPCSYAFVVQEGHFRFSNTSFQQLSSTVRLPMILNWEIGKEPCDAAQEATQNFLCKAHSKCVNPNNRSTGYICKCLPGYEGNPYHPNGCQDIDECKAPNSGSTGVCVNSPGDYSCKCPKGYKNDGMNPKSCIKDNRSKIILLLIISLGVSAGLLILLGAISWLYCCLQRRKFIKLKEKYFKENGGLLLEQHLASQGGSMETTRIFTAEALEKATNNYHESRVLGEGGYGTVYKGILPDNKVVAIKKSKIGASTQKEKFVNEMIVLSQINHRNVVRLLGCCLETSVPLLVYEFVTNGTLFEQIHNIRDKRSLPWDLRMKIATETSGALAYLHSSTSMPIIHRDVNTTNILLDENYTAKVSLKMMGVLLVILLFLGAGITTEAAQALPQALPDCQDKCGDLTVPYPFGITDGCQKEGFPFFTCNTSTQPPNLLWVSAIVSNFSLAEGEMQLQNYISRDCYDKQGFKTSNNKAWIKLPPAFTVSDTKNKFVAVGCDTYAFFRGYRGEEKLTTGCLTLCDTLRSVDQESCSGVGCCQTNIPIGLKSTTLTLDSYYNHTDVWSFNPCSYAFFVEEGHFSFSNKSFDELNNKDTLPVILNWAIGVEEDPCHEAQTRQDFVCKGNSTCVNPINRSGYICRCLQGYQGNPYHPDGCQDIDECKAAINPCNNGDCVNLHGNYTCLCHKGYKMDSINGTTTCVKYNPSSKNMTLKISLGVSTGLLILLGAISWLYCGLQRRKFIKLKEKYFKENGGLLLEQHLASQGGSMETTRIFTAEALEKATNNYHESRVLGEGGYGTVYKGILPDNKVVAIKKSKIGASTQKEQFVNEMIVLSQINHRNVVRLLGCCLETPTPLLVYEFVTNGTLFEQIHNIRDKRSSLPWDLRMKIATETSGALAYLHSSTSMPIMHRDVKTTNILLDENYTAKVSDFGASKLIPVDQTQLTTLVQGTLGYLDPEYFLSNQLTEKSDVYSFGVVLAELLTSRVALCFDRPEAERNLASFFVRSVEEDRLTQILDDDIVNDGNIETLKNVAILAKRCLRLQGEERPTMKEVALELEGMRIMAKHPWGKADCPEETEHLLGSRKSDAYRVDVTAADCGHPSGTSSGYDSMQIQTLMAYGDGR